MGRSKRAAVGGLIYHVLNRANARLPIFEKDDDYEAFERILEQAIERTGTRLLSYCLMPNHWEEKRCQEPFIDICVAVCYFGWLWEEQSERQLVV